MHEDVLPGWVPVRYSLWDSLLPFILLRLLGLLLNLFLYQIIRLLGQSAPPGSYDALGPWDFLVISR